VLDLRSNGLLVRWTTFGIVRASGLDVGHTFGTLADGGAFEFIWVLLALFRGGRLAGIELFELEDLETARARFDALAKDVER